MSTCMLSSTAPPATSFPHMAQPRPSTQSVHALRPYHLVMWDSADDALVAGLAAGDADAATALVRRYQRRVFGLAMAVLGDRGLAEDVAQEAFGRAWRHAGAYGPPRCAVGTRPLTITRS